MHNWRKILSWKQVPREFQIGDKVIPISKSMYGPLEDSISWQNATAEGRNFLWVVELNPWEIDGVIVCDEFPPDHPDVMGDFFLKEDLEPYND